MPVVEGVPVIGHVGPHTTRLTVGRDCDRGQWCQGACGGVVGMFTVCGALQAARCRNPSLFSSLEPRVLLFSCP